MLFKGCLAGLFHFTGVLKFFSENVISMNNFPHEFIHIYQDWVYGGIAKYYKQPGHTNIEFEAYFLVDLFKTLYGAGGGLLAIQDPSPPFADYIDYLGDLRDMWLNNNLNYQSLMNHTSPKGRGYNDFLEYFRDYDPRGGYPLHPSLDNPIPLYDFTDFSGC